MTTPACACQKITLLFLHTHLVTTNLSVVDVVRRAIEALLADVVRVGVLTSLNQLERALALPLCMGISRPPEMLRRVVHRSRAFGHLGLEAYGQKTLASWFERKRVLDPAWQHL